MKLSDHWPTCAMHAGAGVCTCLPTTRPDEIETPALRALPAAPSPGFRHGFLLGSIAACAVWTASGLYWWLS